MELLYDFQVPHVRKLLGVLEHRVTAGDFSDPGTGKTMSACVCARELDLDIFILCPKPTLTNWFETAELVGNRVLGAINYESALRGNYYTCVEDYIAEDRENCPYINVVRDEDGTVINFEFPPCLLVIDEAHRTNNYSTLHAKLMNAALRSPVKKLILSGTMADNLLSFRNAATALGVCPTGKRAYSLWLSRIGKTPEALHASVLPYSSRMRKSDIAVFQPENVHARVFEVNPEIEAEIEAAYADIDQALREIRDGVGDNPLVKLLRARQRIELLKIPTMVMDTMERVDSGQSVAIFVNFTQTLTQIFAQLTEFAEEHDTYLTQICGGQTPEDRDYNVKSFTDDRSRIMIANIQAGGEGISLPDINGVHRKSSLISPPWSSIRLKQTIARINRANSVSPTEVVVVYIKGKTRDHDGNDALFNDPRKGGAAVPANANNAVPAGKVGVEELLAINMNKKLLTMELINNGDNRDHIVI
jgi:hypothetical protein